MRFQPDNPISLGTARDLAIVLQDLVSLATHRACVTLWLRLRMPPEERDYPSKAGIFLIPIFEFGDKALLSYLR